MGTYGRNFGFRVSPNSEGRHGRFAVPSTGSRLPIGAPIKSDVAAGQTSLTQYPVQGVQTVALATSEQVPVNGQCGILVYEYGPAAFAGFDPLLTLYSDLDTVPLGANVQLVNDPTIKVVFKNTAASTFLHVRNYAARAMVAPAIIGATPSVVGSFLSPGTGNDTDGYWAITTDITKAWLVITNVDTIRAEVEAQMMF